MLQNSLLYIVAQTMIAGSVARSHIGDPTYVFTKYLDHQEAICLPSDFNSDKSQAYSLMSEQISSNGGIVNLTEEFESTSDNFSMRAVRDIKKQETVAFVPLVDMITEKVARNG